MNIINQTNPYFMQIEFKPKGIFLKPKEMKDETSTNFDTKILKFSFLGTILFGYIFNSGLKLIKSDFKHVLAQL